MAENTIHWDKDADGIVTLTLDDPTGSANVMKHGVHSRGRGVVAAVPRLAARYARSVSRLSAAGENHV